MVSYTDVDKIVGTILLKTEKPTIVTENDKHKGPKDVFPEASWSHVILSYRDAKLKHKEKTVAADLI